MTQAGKTLDCVAVMRSARDAISKQIQGLTLEAELRWLGEQELGDPVLERLRERAEAASLALQPATKR